ncbi:MAG: diphosphomevalonate decarboxylase [Anaerolineae bacterium]|nr:diphosphomevalonate decarboxylase [Anaerolineae bacterium]
MIWFCLGTAGFEIALVLLYGTVGASSPQAEIEVILVRTVLFILIGYIVHNLVSAQRRQRAELARVVSRNSFPAAAGVASSASGFAALTVAASAALGLSLTPQELAALAREESGSASRSILGGFVEWVADAPDTACIRQLAPADHWDLADVIAIVSHEAKPVSSLDGHARAVTSPLLSARVASLERSLRETRDAIARRDLALLGAVAERDALSLHAVAITSEPGILYWQPGTLAVMHAVRRWRDEGLPAYFTLDAGPNVHILTTAAHRDTVVERVRALPAVRAVLVCGPGRGARLTDDHLL